MIRIFFIIIVCGTPLKISDRTMEKISSQARFLNVLLFLSISVETGGSGHTKPLESLNRGDKVNCGTVLPDR